MPTYEDNHGGTTVTGQPWQGSWERKTGIGTLYRRESNPVISSSPVKIIIACYVHRAYCKPVWELEIFSSAPGRLDDHHECRVDRPFPDTWLGNVWEPSPPAVQACADYLTLIFRASDTFMLSHRPVTSHCGSHSSTSSSTTTSPHLQFQDWSIE